MNVQFGPFLSVSFNVLKLLQGSYTSQDFYSIGTIDWSEITVSDIRSEYEALQNGPKENHWASKNGLQQISEQCPNMSYTLTNKFFDVENIYREEYEFNRDGKWTYPTESRFWSYLESNRYEK